MRFALSFNERLGRDPSCFLEDMHWADQGSLFLPEFMAQEIGETSLLVLATYRDGEVAAPLAQMVGELARLGVPRIMLNGLTLDGTARLLARLTGRRFPTRVVRQIHARTGGNPFFVTEMARADSRDPLAIPDNVRVAISRRLSHLSALANLTLGHRRGGRARVRFSGAPRGTARRRRRSPSPRY